MEFIDFGPLIPIAGIFAGVAFAWIGLKHRQLMFTHRQSEREATLQAEEKRRLEQRLAEWEGTEAAVLTITGQETLLGGQPELDRLIRLRMPYVEPLNHVQIELIRRRRAGDDDSRVREGILLALNGVAAGLRNSG